MGTFLLILTGAALVGVLWFLRRWVWSFPGQKSYDYDGTGPNFDIRDHLKGPILCEGVIYGPTGRVTSRFTADFEASWEENRGRMVENFRYDSGNTQRREWRLEVGPGGVIKANADDLVGEGEGQQAGCSVSLKYKIRLPEEAGGHVLDATDWVYLVGDGVIVNRSQFRKFGIKVAELVATMRPKEA